MHHLTKKLAHDLAPKHITVNAIAPGFVPSKMTAGLLTWGDKDSFEKGIPLGRYATSCMHCIDSGMRSRSATYRLRSYAARSVCLYGLCCISIVLRHRTGRPEDMAGAALYLCGRGGAWVTGSILVVDGGFLCQPVAGLLPSHL